MHITRNSISIDVSLLKDEQFLEDCQCKYGLCQYVGCIWMSWPLSLNMISYKRVLQSYFQKVFINLP